MDIDLDWPWESQIGPLVNLEALSGTSDSENAKTHQRGNLVGLAHNVRSECAADTRLRTLEPAPALGPGTR